MILDKSSKNKYENVKERLGDLAKTTNVKKIERIHFQ